MLKENSRKVYDYVKANDGKNMTAADIAEATGLEVRVLMESLHLLSKRKV